MTTLKIQKHSVKRVIVPVYGVATDSTRTLSHNLCYSQLTFPSTYIKQLNSSNDGFLMSAN